MCYIYDMEKMKRTAIDDAASEIFDAAINVKGLTNKGIERLSCGEIGYNRVRDIRMKLRGPIRLSELIALCGAIGLDPAVTLRQIIARAAAIENTPQEADDQDAPLTAAEAMALAANKDPNRDMEEETPRD